MRGAKGAGGTVTSPSADVTPPASKPRGAPLKKVLAAALREAAKEAMQSPLFTPRPHENSTRLLVQLSLGRVMQQICPDVELLYISAEKESEAFFLLGALFVLDGNTYSSSGYVECTKIFAEIQWQLSLQENVRFASAPRRGYTVRCEYASQSVTVYAANTHAFARDEFLRQRIEHHFTEQDRLLTHRQQAKRGVGGILLPGPNLGFA